MSHHYFGYITKLTGKTLDETQYFFTFLVLALLP
jgi:hypothetical protein